MHQFTLVCLALSATALLAKDLHVSPNGSDESPGTRQQPFASLGKALATMRGAESGTIWLAGRDKDTVACVAVPQASAEGRGHLQPGPAGSRV